MAQVKLYDTTLRDGMGGHGMSLSVGEKLKVVQALDALGVHFVEAGFPSSNPKEAELFERLAELELEQRDDRRLRHDPAPRPSRPPTTRRSPSLVASFAPVVCLVGKSWRLAPGEGDPRLRRGEPGDDRRLGRLLPRRRASGPSSTPSTSSTATATTPPTRSNACAPPPRPGAENVTLCDTNGGSLPAFVAEATAAVVEALGDAVEVGIHTHNDAECAVANSLAAVEAGARLVQGCVNGYGERCGNANLASILPALQLKMGFEVVGDEQLASLTPTSHYLDELCNMAPDPDQPYVGRNAFAHKAGMHAAGVAADASTFEHLDPARVGNERDILASELSGQGDDPHARPSRPASSSTTRRPRARSSGSRSASTAATTTRRRRPPSSCCCARRRAVYAPLFELESFRVTTEKREGGEVETEATIKVVVDGERYVEVAEGNGPVNALDKALRARDRRPPPAPRRDRADQLQGADPRRDARHRRGHPGPARLHRRRARVGDDRRLGEHHRGLLGGARRLARLRLPAAPRRCGRHSPTDDNEPIPLAQAASSARARRSWCSRCCARAGSRWGRWASASSAPSPSGSGSRTRSPSPAAPRRCTSACGRWAGARATRC